MLSVKRARGAIVRETGASDCPSCVKSSKVTVTAVGFGLPIRISCSKPNEPLVDPSAKSHVVSDGAPCATAGVKRAAPAQRHSIANDRARDMDTTSRDVPRIAWPPAGHLAGTNKEGAVRGI